MEITFLGTSSMVPTKNRNVQAIYLEYVGEGILIDCGEGTQRQMNIAGINRLKVRKILISHWHGDHVSGLIGLIQTIGSCENPKTLEIFGPEGTKKHLNHLLNSCIFDLRIEIKVHEIKTSSLKTIYENENYEIKAISMNHNVPCLAYSFEEKDKRKMIKSKLEKFGLKGKLVGDLQKGLSVKINNKKVSPEDVSKLEKGKKVTFILDTAYNVNCEIIAKDSDLLISESTYDLKLQEKAKEYFHLTSKDAATIAKNSNSKRLILTHFSQRYKSLDNLKKQAKDVFKNVELAKDFLKIKL